MKPKSFKKKKTPQISDDDQIAELESVVTSFNWSNFNSFDDIPISSKTKNGLRNSGYYVPTDIQKQSIGYALCENDILGAAKTGSGKTIAFLVPMLECLYKNRWTSFDGVGALIISPTRELAYQIFEVLKKVGADHDFSAGLIIGGKDLKFERKRMDRCNIIVCTPGRLLQHMDENALFNCDNLKMLILDEADRILDLGFSQTMNAIIENLPLHRQTLLFSATQTKSVKDLARLSLKEPVYISSHENEKHSTPNKLEQNYIICQLQEKINLLWSFIKQHNKEKIIVFMSSCKQVKFVYELFCHLRPGIPLLALYGTLHQVRRMSIYDKFCQSSRNVLFSTDIASRGLDFPSVNWVIQFDCPEDVNTYIHRVGRTARFEKGGKSLLILLPTEEPIIRKLEDNKVPIEKIAVNPKKIVSIQRKIEAFLARNFSLKESAQRAFKAYLKNVFLMKDKSIFKFDELDINEFARSLGLVVTPRVRFVERKQKLANKSKEINSNKISNEDQILDGKIENSNKTQAKNEFHLNDNIDDDSEDDLFKVKQVWRYEEEESDQAPETIVDKKHKKSLSKIAASKRLLKKNIKLNTKVVFNENSEAILEGYPKGQSSQYLNELDNVDSGINIEIAKKIMKEEDQIDKKLYRNVIKEKHLKKKLKLKEIKNKNKGSNEVQLFDEVDEEDEETTTQQYIDELPDPDKVFNNSDSEIENDDDRHSSTGYESNNLKRTLSESEEEFYTDYDYDQRDKLPKSHKKQNLNLEHYENLALSMLKNRS